MQFTMRHGAEHIYASGDEVEIVVSLESAEPPALIALTFRPEGAPAIPDHRVGSFIVAFSFEVRADWLPGNRYRAAGTIPAGIVGGLYTMVQSSIEADGEDPIVSWSPDPDRTCVLQVEDDANAK